LTLDTLSAVEPLVRLGFDRENGEHQVRAQLGAPPPDPERSERELNALEKQIEHEGDVMMQRLGFEAIRFSHPGKTRHTAGIPGRRYYRRPRAGSLALGVGRVQERRWATTPTKLFQELVEACSEAYVIGGLGELAAWSRKTL
jgi:hypothetical protein